MPGAIDSPEDVIYSDIDGDGDTDVLAAGSGAGEIIWWLNPAPLNGNEPNPFTLLSPENQSVIHTRGPSLQWETATDPDETDVIRYVLYWTINDPTFANADSVTNLVDPEYVFQEEELIAGIRKQLNINGELDDLLPDDQRIYWKVRAQDRNTSGTWSTPGGGFYFDIDAPDPPIPFNLLTPINATVLDVDSVEVTWESTIDPDAEPGQMVTYYLWWATDDMFTENVDSVHVLGTSYMIRDLQDDQGYNWKVRAQDANTAGTWSNQTLVFFTDIPNPPEPFNLVSPVPDHTFNVPEVNMRWQQAIDPDAEPGDQIEYTVYWSTSEDFSENLDSAETTNRAYIYEDFQDNQTYWWKVLARDANTSGTWSNQTWNFNIILFDPPSAFSLLGPDNESIVETDTVVFSWEESVDQDIGDEVSYVIWWAYDENFQESLDSIVVNDTQYTLSGYEDNSVIYWKVRAQDTNTLGTWSNETFMFTVIIQDPPEPFSLYQPINRAYLNLMQDGFDVAFSWFRSSDPDPDEEVTYRLTINASLDGNEETVTRIWNDLVNNSIRINIPETFGYGITHENLRINWWVEAISRTDTVRCNQDFSCTIEPYNEVAEWREGGIPVTYELTSLYPNPFNPTLTAIVGLPESGDLTVEVFNLLGERVATLAEGRYQAGYHEFLFKAGGFPSGIYLVRAFVPGELLTTRKVMLLK